MVIYCKSVHFRGFSSPGSPGQAFYEMVSFSENRVLRLLQESGEARPGSHRPGQSAPPALTRRAGGEGLTLMWGPPRLTDPHPPQETALSATT